MNDLEIEPRLIELETRLAFQDDLLEKMQARLNSQDKQLYKMVDELKELREQIRSGNETGVIPLSEEAPPPHY